METVLKSTRTYDMGHSRVDVVTLPVQNGEFGENLWRFFTTMASPIMAAVSDEHHFYS